MSLVDLHGMPAQLVAAMADAVAVEPRVALMNQLLDRGSVPEEERPIPMKEDGAETMDVPELLRRIEDGELGDPNG